MFGEYLDLLIKKVLGPIKATSTIYLRTLDPLGALKKPIVKSKEAVIFRGSTTCQSIAFPAPIKKVVGGMDHLMFLLEDGQIFGLGSNVYGQLGVDLNSKTVNLWSVLKQDDDSDEWFPEPQPLETLNGFSKCKIIDVAAGHFSTFAVTDDHKLYGWGAGILGTGDEYYDSHPQLIKSLKHSNVTGIQGWQDVILAKNGKNENFIFGAIMEQKCKLLVPTLSDIEQLPESTAEYPNTPILYMSHQLGPKLTLPKFTMGKRLPGEYFNYNYAVFYRPSTPGHI